MSDRRRKTWRSRLNTNRLTALIDEATVNCYNDSEAVVGFFTMIDEHLDVPFETVVLGVDVKVTAVELTQREEIVAVCVRGSERQRVPVCDLPMPSPPPSGAEWIEAYRHWTTGQ